MQRHPHEDYVRCSFTDNVAFFRNFREVHLLSLAKHEGLAAGLTFPLFEYLIQDMRNLNWPSGPEEGMPTLSPRLEARIPIGVLKNLCLTEEGVEVPLLSTRTSYRDSGLLPWKMDMSRFNMVV